MTKRCSILQSKLHELESKLHDALLLRHDQNPCLSEDIKQKFAFIKNLLSAEISSSPPASTPRHLQHVAGRIEQWEDAFLKWDSSRAFSCEEFEIASSCSCTDSCFNDDGGEAGGELGVAAAFAEPEEIPVGSKAMEECEEPEDCQGFDGEKKAIVKWEGDEGKKMQKVRSLLVYEDAKDHFLEGLDHGELLIRKELGDNDIILKGIEMRREERKFVRENSETSSEFGHICGAMSFGVVVGMAFMWFMMLKFSGCSHFVDQPYFTIPT